MGYCIQKRDRSVEASVRRIAAEQIALAAESLVATDLALPLRIHTARKSVKKLRGLIRMVRPSFDDFQKENSALREAGQLISSLREAHVALDTFDRLTQAAGLEGSQVLHLRLIFEAQSAVTTTPEAMSRQIELFGEQWRQLGKRAQRWKLRREGFDALDRGLGRSFAGVVATERLARKHADGAEEVHEWRKRVKDQGYQARLLAPIRPKWMQTHGDAVEALGENLGLCQDISVLLAALPEDPFSDLLRSVGHRQRAAILTDAHSQSRHLFTGSPKAFTARWGAWWQVWQKA